MKGKGIRIAILILLVGAAAGYYVWNARPVPLVLTGIVTTNDVMVSAQIPGQIGQLLVKEGDIVTKNQVVAVIVPDELRADTTYYAQTAAGATSAVAQNEAAVRYEEQQASSQVTQAEAALAAAEAARQSSEADLENAKLTFERNQSLLKGGAVSAEQFDQSRTTYRRAPGARRLAREAGRLRARHGRRWRKSQAEQVSMRRGQLQAVAARVGRRRRAARQGGGAPRLHRNPRADRRHRRGARGACRAKSSRPASRF